MRNSKVDLSKQKQIVAHRRGEIDSEKQAWQNDKALPNIVGVSNGLDGS